MRPVALAGWLLAAAGSLQADESRATRERLRFETYDVSGETAQQLRRDLNGRGPLSHGKRYDARTDWHVQWRFDLERGERGCHVERPRVDLDVLITLPHWRRPASASPALVEQWETYLLALREHEDGHREVGQSAADEILALLGAQPDATSCAAAERLANAASHEIIERHNRRDERYDRETRHGATQGARFP